jgi:hypothetical protein
MLYEINVTWRAMVEKQIIKNGVEEEIKIINEQLQQLDKEKSIAPLIGGIITLFISIGLGLQLKILFYWIPSSLTLIFIWSIISFFHTRKKSLTEEKAKETMNIIKQYNTKTWEYASDLFIKQLFPFMVAISIIFVMNIVVVLLHLSDIIILPFGGIFELIIISLVSLFFVISLFFIEKFPKFFSQYVLPVLSKIPKIEKEEKVPPIIRNNIIKIIIAAGTLYIFSFIILYLFALILIFPSIENIWFMFLVIFLQIVIIILFSAYISYLRVKTELNKCLVNLRRIKDGDLNKIYLLDVVKFSRFAIDNSLKFVNVFMIIRHIKYLRNIKEKQ